MCLTVDQSGNGQDLVISGSKDHYIKVCESVLWCVAVLLIFAVESITATHTILHLNIVYCVEVSVRDHFLHVVSCLNMDHVGACICFLCNMN